MASSPDDWADDIPHLIPTPALRVQGHQMFDPIWRLGHYSRNNAYKELAKVMGVDEREAHFKRMDRKMLGRAFVAIREIRYRLGIDPVAEVR